MSTEMDRRLYQSSHPVSHSITCTLRHWLKTESEQVLTRWRSSLYFNMFHLTCINQTYNKEINNKMFIMSFIYTFLTRMYSPHLYLCIFVIKTSRCRKQQYRPKHVGEESVNKVLHKHCREFCWLFIYYRVHFISPLQHKHCFSTCKMS